jgi:hypothetical protein
MHHTHNERFAKYEHIIARLPPARPAGQGLNFCCPFGDRHRHGADRNPSAFVKIGRAGELVAACLACGANWREFQQYVGLPACYWFPITRARIMSTNPPKKVAEYPYHGEDGSLLAVKTRWEPGFHGEKKSFSWRRPIPNRKNAWAAGSGVIQGGEFRLHQTRAGWHEYRQGESGSDPIFLPPLPGLSLYRLPELLRSDPLHPVILVEGEKKVDRLQQLGFVATTSYAGASKWDLAWGCHFAGRRLCIIPDWGQTDPGLEYAHKVAASAMCFQALEIRIVRLPISELRPDGSGGDILDWLRYREERGQPADRQAVAKLCSQFTPYRFQEE